MASRPRIPAQIELIQRSIDTIEERLDGELSLEALAQAAGVSFWHFLRIFRATVGETPKEYIRRRRLTRAATALLETRRSVLDIALEAGFESNEAFTRAFRMQFDQAPRDFRSAGLRPAFPRAKREISAEYLSHLQEGISRAPRLAQHPNLRLAGIKTEFAVPPDAFDVLALGALAWEAFVEGLPQIARRIDDKAYFFCEIFASGSGLLRGSLMPCVAVEDFGDLPEGWHTDVRAAARDAVFLHKGGGRAWEYTLHYVFDTWRAEAPQRLGERPAFYRFDPQHSPFSAAPELELWLALNA